MAPRLDPCRLDSAVSKQTSDEEGRALAPHVGSERSHAIHDDARLIQAHTLQPIAMFGCRESQRDMQLGK